MLGVLQISIILSIVKVDAKFVKLSGIRKTGLLALLAHQLSIGAFVSFSGWALFEVITNSRVCLWNYGLLIRFDSDWCGPLVEVVSSSECRVWPMSSTIVGERFSLKFFIASQIGPHHVPQTNNLSARLS